MSDENDDALPDESSEVLEQEPEEQFEDAKELTDFFSSPPWLDRKKIMMVGAVILSIVVVLGLISSSKKPKSKQAVTDYTSWAANPPNDFLQRELQTALNNTPPAEQSELEKLTAEYNSRLISVEEYLQRLQELQNKPDTSDQYGLPIVSSTSVRAPAYVPPPAQAPQQQSTERKPQPQLSSLVPRMEGSLFTSQAAQQAPSQQAQDPYSALLSSLGGMGQAGLPASLAGLVQQDSYSGLSSLAQQDPYTAQNDQAGKNSFFNSSVSGSAIAGDFLQGNLLWIGTIIPAVLETAINTDLPGNVIARVTENVYDSQTGKNILIPQGTILVAQYNSSVSYAQRRVQVVWDVLIRPDGYQVTLEGMNGVDPRGIAGLKAVYHENWFEYIKAAGIISLFSIINSKMVEEVAKYGSEEMASGVITSNAEFIKDMGGNFISRALNIQPTLTIDNGEKINIMLNKNIYLPPFKNFEVKQRYKRQ
jgi:type IV secretory pathway VirB10-like protein